MIKLLPKTYKNVQINDVSDSCDDNDDIPSEAYISEQFMGQDIFLWMSKRWKTNYTQKEALINSSEWCIILRGFKKKNHKC